MIALGIVSGVAGLGVLCWLMFNLAVQALPFFAAVSMFLWAYREGMGPLGAVAVGLLTGVLVLVAGQCAFTIARAPTAKLAIALLFAVPAALAGYGAAHGVATLNVSSQAWRIALSVSGALLVGGTAFLRMMRFVADDISGRKAHSNAHL